MKNKQTVKLAAALIILAAALGIYSGISRWNESASEVVEEDTSVRLTQMAAEDIVQFSYVYNFETRTFVKKDQVWYYEGDSDINIKQSTIEGKLSSVVSTTGSRMLEIDEENLAEYGLEEPSNTIVLTDKEGNETVFEIGDYNSAAGEYYCRLNRSNQVYLVSSSLSSMMSFDASDVEETQESETAEETAEESPEESQEENE